jgi:serine protease Do
MVVSGVTEPMRQQLQLPDRRGVVVESVSGKAAREAGIQQGDIILSLNNTQITDVKQFNELVKGLPADRTVALLVQRDTGPLFLALHVPE